MIDMLFEDDQNSEISTLLKSANSKLLFSNGNRNLNKVMLDWSIKNNTDNFLILFCDVVPDNVKTIQTYNKLVSSMIQNNIENVILLPIPCIEFYCIKSWIVNKFDLSLILKFANEYWLHANNFCGKTLSIKSFEKYCKSVLINHVNCLSSNKFYRRDCNIDCDIQFDLCKRKLIKFEKASSLYCSLPLHKPMDNEIVRAVNYNEIVNIINNLMLITII